MYYAVKYGLLLLVITLLQVLLFNNLDFNIYITPFVYLSFVLLLPMGLPSIYVLLLGLAMGLAMDLSMGMIGINTIASLFTAYSRPFILEISVGKELFKDGGVPSIQRLGVGRMFRYILFFCFIHSTIFFLLETLSFEYLYLTILQIIFSSLTTVVLVFFVSLAFQHKPILRL